MPVRLYVDPATGNFYAVDRAYTVGGFGYVGARRLRSTPEARSPAPIGIRLYADLRQGMSGLSVHRPQRHLRGHLSFASSSSTRPAAGSSGCRSRGPRV